MPKVSHAFEAEVRRAIRDAYALDPLIDKKRVLEFVNKRFNRSFDWSYIARLTKKVNVEATPNLDKEKVEYRLRVMRERARILIEAMLKIVHASSVSTQNKIAAARAIAIQEKLLLDAELDLGVYNRSPKADLVDSFRYRAIPDEIRAAMVDTAREWNLPTDLRRRIEPVHMEIVEVEAIPAEEPKNAATTPVAPPKPTKPHGIQPDPVFA